MKFLSIYIKEDLNIFLNLNEIKKIVLNVREYEIHLFSGDVYRVTQQIPDEMFDSDELTDFLEDEHKIIFSIS